MSHHVIPAPLRFKADSRQRFSCRSGMAVLYEDAALGPGIERFCSETARRTGIELISAAGQRISAEPSIRVELASGNDLTALATPRGVWPAGSGPADERHSLTIDEDQIVVRAVESAGALRALTTLLQLLAMRANGAGEEISVPCARILDAPRYAWRGLSLDVARTFFPVAEILRVIDLLTLYKLNVLHLHLTDDQGWRLPMGRLPAHPNSDDRFYSVEDLRTIVRYAEDRLVTIVPEIEMPGHASAIIQLHPELDPGRHIVKQGLSRGKQRPVGWLDPELPATFNLIEKVLADVAAIFSSSYIHIGGDEPQGMPPGLYSTYVQHVRGFLRSIGKRPLGWQESARAGLGPEDVIQYWLTGIAFADSLPAEIRKQLHVQLSSDLVMSSREIETALAASASVILSPLNHCYLDIPYADPSADALQTDRRGRVGMRRYAPRTVAESFEWEPAQVLGARRAGQVAGVEAAIWTETIADFDDLSFLLLPRLPGIAHKAWGEPTSADWRHHRASLARHARLWEQDDLTYFRTSAVDWL
jgi:hexosaminidase